MKAFMTIPAVADPAPVVVPAQSHELFAELDDAHQTIIAAEAKKVEMIHRLCRAFSCVDDMAYGEAAEKLTRYGADGTPPVAEYLSLEVAALLSISPATGAGLIGQVLDCVHRHPMLWEAVRAGEVRWYRATEIIQEVNASNLCQAAALWVDERITPQLNALTRGPALRLLRGYIALADPEQARERQERARTRRHVTVWSPTVESGPCRELTGRLDLTDAAALDATLNELAAVLAAEGDQESLDHRRATARAWKLTQYEGGWLEWTSPAGYRYATGPYGTLREVRTCAA